MPIGRPRMYARRVLVHITAAQDAAIKAEGRAFGVSEPDVIRAALDAYLFPRNKESA